MRTFFPIAQIVAMNFGAKERTALGNYGPYRTHRLRLAADRPREGASRIAVRWFDHFCSGDVCLDREDAFGRTANPFIIARADRSIVDAHGGIWKDRFVSFVADFIAAVNRRPASSAQRLADQ